MDGKKLQALLFLFLFVLFGYIRTLSHHPLVMLIIYDGFRWDYLDTMRAHRYNLPNFDRIRKTGVSASHLLNVFPTVTMTNHMSLLTGNYAESHGVIGNSFYDSIMNKWYHMGKGSENISGFFDAGAEPIWVTNQRASNDQFTGSTLFPCTFAAVRGVNVTYRVHDEIFNTNVTYEERVDTVIHWFLAAKSPINLALFYYEEPDFTAHKFGPGSQQLFDSVLRLDRLTGYLLEQLEKNDLLDKMNMIFTADHGMAYISQNRTVNIDDYVDRGDYNSSYLHPYGLLEPKPGLEHSVFNKLKKMEDEHRQVRVFWKNDTSPEIKALHYSNNHRIMSILLLLDVGWTVVHSQDELSIGTHGYNSSNSEMWPFFIATGPAFKENFRTGELHLVDVYELMCYILQIRPAPNNGSLDRIRHILKPDFRVSLMTYATYVVAITLCLAIAAVISAAAISARKVTSINDPVLYKALLTDDGGNDDDDDDDDNDDESEL